MQLLAKGNPVLQKHLSLARGNAKYTSKTIQNDIIHLYACKIKEKLTTDLRNKRLPFVIIADEVTDSYSNQEILSVCLRYVDLSSHSDPHIRECFINFVYLERAKADMIESLSDTSVSLNPANIRGQAYDGAAVMSSGLAGVHGKIKKVSPLALYTHCYSHSLNLSIAAACKAQEVRDLIGIINEMYLFVNNSPKRQKLFELTLHVYLSECTRSKLSGLCKTRWVERHVCFQVFHEIFEVLVTFLMLFYFLANTQIYLQAHLTGAGIGIETLG